MCCSADPSNFLKAVKNLKSSRANFFEAVEAPVRSPSSLCCLISLSFTTLCPLFSPFLFDHQVVNSAWRVSGMYKIHPHHGRGSVGAGRQPAPDPLAASSRQLWGQKGWKFCTLELQHLLLQNFWVLDVLREGVCIVPVPQAKCLLFFSSRRCLFLNEHSSLLSPELCILLLLWHLGVCK